MVKTTNHIVEQLEIVRRELNGGGLMPPPFDSLTVFLTLS